MIFEKANPDKFEWGYYLRILPKGKLSIGYSTPCGNDPNRFHKEGKWSYNSRTKAFMATIDVHKRGKIFTIKFISDSKMVLEYLKQNLGYYLLGKEGSLVNEALCPHPKSFP